MVVAILVDFSVVAVVAGLVGLGLHLVHVYVGIFTV